MNISQDEGRENIPEDDLLVKVSFRLKIGNLIDSNLMQLLPLKFSQNIVKSLLGETGVFEEPVAATIAPEAPPVTPPPVQQQIPVAPPSEQPVYQQQSAPMQRTDLSGATTICTTCKTCTTCKCATSAVC